MSDDTRETIPITSPLAVLTTRTTQEHIMTTHSATDLKPGDIVQHPEKGRGYILRNGGDGRLRVNYASQAHSSGYVTDLDLDGWERVETVRPGHVQVRVDDLDRQTLSEWSQWSVHCTDDEALVRVGRAMIASQVEHGDPSSYWPAESTPPADEKPTSATVTLPCPDCGEAITREVCPVRVENSRTPKWSLEFLRSPGAVGERSHTCPPAQPDEPTEFGARVTVTLPDGTREKWCRLGQNHPAPWLGEAYGVPGEEWRLLCGRGTVTIGWDE